MPKEIKPSRFLYHPKHNPNVTCRYHAGYIGHSIEAYFIFKNKVQELLDQKFIFFTEKPCQVILMNDRPQVQTPQNQQAQGQECQSQHKPKNNLDQSNAPMDSIPMTYK